MVSKQEQREELLSIFSDTYKDLNGFRPTGFTLKWSLTTLREKTYALCDELHDQIEAERDR